MRLMIAIAISLAAYLGLLVTLFAILLDDINGVRTIVDNVYDAVDGLRADDVNPYARMLGRVVEARKTEDSDWEPYVVVAVGWHGSMCLRTLSEPSRNGFWMHREDRHRIRELVA